MASGNTALAFGALLAGAVVIEYGVKNAKSAFGGSSSTAPSTSGGVGLGNYKTGTVKAGKLNSNQATFARRLAQRTGLDINVVTAWLLAEEPASSSQAPNGANNWLNIGSTGSGFFGGSNPAWSDPVTAADQTASWLAGGSTVGYGKASSGIRSIISRALGKSPHQQIAAIQSSGWAASGYPLLGEVYNEVSG